MSRRLWRLLVLSATSAVLTAAIPAAVSGATTLNVPGSFATIQAAIDASAPGDTVLVAPGTYREHIDFKGKAITVASSGGPGPTVIDGGGAGLVVNFSSGETRSSVLQGFTIQNGSETPPGIGAGIRVFQASPTIRGNVITGNQACGGGGGISAETAAPLIQDNVIASNDGSELCTGSGGGAILLSGNALDGSTAQILGNTITGNQADEGGALNLFGAGTVLIEDNVISGNTSHSDGGGIWVDGPTNAIMVQNLVVNNQSGEFGGGLWGGGALVANTFAGNTALEGSAVWAGSPPATFSDNILVGAGLRSVVYCDSTAGVVQPPFDHNDAFATDGGTAFGANCGAGAGSDGNISADPRLVGSGDYQLQPGSPAIDAGNDSAPDLPATDLAGNPRIIGAAVDMGAYEAVANPAVATFSPATVNFGTLHSGPTVTFAPLTLTNTGGAPLQVSADQTQPPFSVGADGCAGASLAPGASCVVQVGFLPGTAGAASGSLQVTDSLGVQSVTLEGTVVAGQVATSPTSWSFGTVRVGRQSKATTVTVRNAGTGSLHVGSLTLTGANPGDFAIVSGAGTNCANATLQVGATCTVQVVFRPTATGARSASLSIASDDPASPAGVPLTGTGG